VQVTRFVTDGGTWSRLKNETKAFHVWYSCERGRERNKENELQCEGGNIIYKERERERERESEQGVAAVVPL
jgi:hypothetical protein